MRNLLVWLEKWISIGLLVPILFHVFRSPGMCTVVIYPFQQWRLIPLLAATYALIHFSKTLFQEWLKFYVGLVLGESDMNQVEKLFNFTDKFILKQC